MNTPSSGESDAQAGQHWRDAPLRVDTDQLLAAVVRGASFRQIAVLFGTHPQLLRRTFTGRLATRWLIMRHPGGLGFLLIRCDDFGGMVPVGLPPSIRFDRENRAALISYARALRMNAAENHQGPPGHA